MTDVYSEKEAEEEEMEEGVFVNPEEDEEDARLFGGGLSSQQEQIAQILDRDQSDQATSGSQAATLRKQIVRFERAVTKNQQLRVKFAHDPHKCVAMAAFGCQASANHAWIFAGTLNLKPIWMERSQL